MEAGPEHGCALGRGREEGGHIQDHLADTAGRRLLPPERDPRPAARGRECPVVRRLADDPLGPEDVARDGQAAHHPWITDVLLNLTSLRALPAPPRALTQTASCGERRRSSHAG